MLNFYVNIMNFDYFQMSMNARRTPTFVEWALVSMTKALITAFVPKATCYFLMAVSAGKLSLRTLKFASVTVFYLNL